MVGGVKVEVFPYKDIEMATGRFGGHSFLGRGSHGCVYKGVLQGGKIVAVKRQRDIFVDGQSQAQAQSQAQDPSPLANEIQILSELHSPRLVKLVGVSHYCSSNSQPHESSFSRETLLVVEYMANGTLHDVLHCSTRPATWARRVHIALQTAKAIRDLHRASPPVIHRDIKSANVLIDSKWNARLGDFGLALRAGPQSMNNNQPPAGTMGYLDPSYVTPCGLSPKNDVFSFGILLLEIISGRKPIDVNHRPACIVDWALPLIQQARFQQLCDPRIKSPTRSKSKSLKQMAELGALCICSDLHRRPSMDEVVKQLKHVSRCIPLPLPLWTTISSFLGRRTASSETRKTSVIPKHSSITRHSYGPNCSSRVLGSSFSGQKGGSSLRDLLDESGSESDCFAESGKCFGNQHTLTRSLSLPVLGGNRRGHGHGQY